MFKSMKRIIRWAGKYRGRLYLGSVFSFFSSLSTAIPTMAAAYALDKSIQAYWAHTTIDASLIWKMLWIIVGSIALNFLFSYLRAILQESIGYEVAAGQRIHLGDVLKRVPLGYFSQNSVGDILAGVTTELSTLELQGMKMVDVIINGYAKFIAIVLCLIFFSPVAAVISVVGVVLSALALQGISRHSERTAATTHNAMEDMLSRVLRLCAGTWEGDENSFSANILNGITRLVYTFGNQLNDEVFKERVGALSIKQLVRMSKERCPGSMGYAEAMLLEYNGKKKNISQRLSMNKLHMQGTAGLCSLLSDVDTSSEAATAEGVSE